jgi:large subunit ribosomal protein L36e
LLKPRFVGLRTGLNKGYPTTAIAQAPRPSQRKGVQSTKTKFVRSVIREVAGFSAYERRVMELLRNSKVRCERIPKGDLLLTAAAGQEGSQADQEEGWSDLHALALYADPLPPQLGTLLRSKRKLEELSNVIQESRRTAH